MKNIKFSLKISQKCTDKDINVLQPEEEPLLRTGAQTLNTTMSTRIRAEPRGCSLPRLIKALNQQKEEPQKGDQKKQILRKCRNWDRDHLVSSIWSSAS